MASRIGIDIGGTKIEALALDVAGREIFRKRVPTPSGDYTATINAVKALVGDAGPGSVGIGIPGAMSQATGLIKNANSTWLIGKPLKQDLERALGREVRLANDANCFALSEAVDGAGPGAGVVFGVILGTGVGGGVVVNGQVLTGANAIAGEWGHNPLPLPQPEDLPLPPCYCGRRAASRPTCQVRVSRATMSAGRATRLSPEEVVARARCDALERYVGALRGTACARARVGHQRARSRSHRPGRRNVEGRSVV